MFFCAIAPKSAACAVEYKAFYFSKSKTERLEAATVHNWGHRSVAMCTR